MLILCGGFLLAVLWMDLMFDVQILRHRRSGPELPESVLASIAAYYRRVTTDARPLGHLVGLVMLVTLAGVAAQIVRGVPGRGLGLLSLALCGLPIGLAITRIHPNAVRLGSRTGSPPEQSALARAICRDHLLCFAGIASFVALQLWAAG